MFNVNRKKVIKGIEQDNYTPSISTNKQVINLVNDVRVTKDKENKDARETVNKLMVTEEQAKESVGLKVLHDKKIYENGKLGINDYKMNPDTKITKADIERFENDKGNIERMSREEVLEDDVKH